MPLLIVCVGVWLGHIFVALPSAWFKPSHAPFHQQNGMHDSKFKALACGGEGLVFSRSSAVSTSWLRRAKQGTACFGGVCRCSLPGSGDQRRRTKGLLCCEVVFYCRSKRIMHPVHQVKQASAFVLVLLSCTSGVCIVSHAVILVSSRFACKSGPPRILVSRGRNRCGHYRAEENGACTIGQPIA